jgi:hypothetical protein
LKIIWFIIHQLKEIVVRSFILISFLILLICLTSCDSEFANPSGPDLIATNSNGQKKFLVDGSEGESIPHKGAIYFYPTLVEQTSDPLVVKISFEGQGRASQFGRFTEIGEYLLHSDEAGTPLFISDVIATRYTANGDEVYLANVTGAITVTGDPEHPMILEGDYNYEGGTGRFKSITGTLHWRALGNADGSAVAHFKGEIGNIGHASKH